MSAMLRNLMREALNLGYILCRRCGENLEYDAEECSCGWKNPLMRLGLI